MHYLYILVSETKSRTYTGVTESIEKRLKEHNSGRVKSSRPYRPYKILCTQVSPTLIEAHQAERFYKSTAGRRRLKQMISTLENDTR